MGIKYSAAKWILQKLYALPSDTDWAVIKAIYKEAAQKFGITEPNAGKPVFSPWYNRFTSQLQTHRLKSAPIGYRDVLYFDRYHKSPPNRQHPQVTTWDGKPIGEVTSLAFFQSKGFAPCKRVSITFRYRGMTFRGICSYENMQCFNVKRVG